eukprot:TRINITY_DN15363_c0_g1_i1.p1 TRINITY_DN15363_c0_g1~~TRINITY_DN15363_c0_g1_i1.p1  ORF type:complete len:266 (-),score=77.50 TRINITY_DN15363_c0_g1_i1:12-809(-)
MMIKNNQRTIMKKENLINHQTKNNKKKKTKIIITRKSRINASSTLIGFFVLMFSSLGLYFYFNYKRAQIKKDLNKSIGRADIGGSWTLVDHYGRPVTSTYFKEKFQIIYFGFTFCPDICPTELTKMGEVLEELEKRGYGSDTIQPLMVSVDPGRDTVGQLREYCKEFHPRLLGLTGTPEQIYQICKKFRVYSSKPPVVEEGEEMEQDYLVDHSIFMYLMNDQNQFLEVYGQDKEAEYIIEDIAKHIAKSRESEYKTFWKSLLGIN